MEGQQRNDSVQCQSNDLNSIWNPWKIVYFIYTCPFVLERFRSYSCSCRWVLTSWTSSGILLGDTGRKGWKWTSSSLGANPSWARNVDLRLDLCMAWIGSMFMAIEFSYWLEISRMSSRFTAWKRLTRWLGTWPDIFIYVWSMKYIV